ncbi:MAG: hypothetical protein R3240_04205, partial [Gammaproteobacteria bacterium]|nr:hypothetical protein [Gammaproteobacteria bacterium]
MNACKIFFRFLTVASFIFLALISNASGKPLFVLPDGYQEEVIADEKKLNLFPGSDWNDMMTLNESGKYPNRYLYRTHEIR